jgi:hypothetical protein
VGHPPVDFEEAFLDFGGGEAGELVEVGILGGGEGEIAFGVASIAKSIHVLNTSKQPSIDDEGLSNHTPVDMVKIYGDKRENWFRCRLM